MKVLQLSKYYEPVKGGLELVAREMTKAHRFAGDEVFIVAFSEKEDREVGSLGEKILRIKQDLFFLSTPISLSFFFAFQKLLRSQKFQRLYVHLPNPYMHELVRLSTGLLRELKIQVIGVYHSDILNKGFLGELYQYYFLKTEAVYDSFICSSENLQSSSNILSKVNPLKVTVIPYCVEETAGPLPALNGSGHFLSIGRMVPYKGFEFLIRAFNKTSYKLTLIGQGPLFKELKKIAGPNIEFKGQASDQEKLELMRSVDALIVSSISEAEAYGMTIVEAFHMGLPVIASRIKTGVTYLVRNEETGFLFDINNEAQLLEILQKLKERPELLKLYSKRGKDFYHDEVRFDLFQRKLLDA